jgi:hypothetical protein
MIAHLMGPVWVHIGNHVATAPVSDFWNTIGIQENTDKPAAVNAAAPDVEDPMSVRVPSAPQAA